jgi:hypothetical protein
VNCDLVNCDQVNCEQVKNCYRQVNYGQMHFDQASFDQTHFEQVNFWSRDRFFLKTNITSRQAIPIPRIKTRLHTNVDQTSSYEHEINISYFYCNFCHDFCENEQKINILKRFIIKNLLTPYRNVLKLLNKP